MVHISGLENALGAVLSAYNLHLYTNFQKSSYTILTVLKSGRWYSWCICFIAAVCCRFRESWLSLQWCWRWWWWNRSDLSSSYLLFIANSHSFFLREFRVPCCDGERKGRPKGLESCYSAAYMRDWWPAVLYVLGIRSWLTCWCSHSLPALMGNLQLADKPP